jgi:replicative DNA helicase
MSESMLDDFEKFFIELPSNVRHDLSFMMATLSDENLVIDGTEDFYESAMRRLFGARTRIGRIGNLINAVAVFDVYFVMDARGRFNAARQVHQSAKRVDGTTDSRRGYYADQIEAIEAAKRRWVKLRATSLAHRAITAALDPMPLPARRAQRSSPTLQPQEQSV